MSETSTEPQSWLSISAAARRLDILVNTLRRWADNGQIACAITPGGHRRFSSDDIAEFIEKRRRLRRPFDVEQSWAEAALTVTRQSLAEHKVTPTGNRTDPLGIHLSPAAQDKSLVEYCLPYDC